MEIDAISEAVPAPPLGERQSSKPDPGGDKGVSKALGAGTGGGSKGPPGAPRVRIDLQASASKGGTGGRAEGGDKGRAVGGGDGRAEGGAACLAKGVTGGKADAGLGGRVEGRMGDRDKGGEAMEEGYKMVEPGRGKSSRLAASEANFVAGSARRGDDLVVFVRATRA